MLIITLRDGGESVSITLESLNDQAMQRSDLDELRILS